MRYRIIFKDDSGHFKLKILAIALEGEIIGYVKNFDERGNHLGLLEFPSEKLSYADALLTNDSSVISYRNTRYV
jgi:hypothetical protein